MVPTLTRTAPLPRKEHGEKPAEMQAPTMLSLKQEERRSESLIMDSCIQQTRRENYFKTSLTN